MERNQFITMKDETTGRLYERLTPEGMVSHYPYFYLHMIDPLSNNMLILIEKEERRNLYLLNLEDGTLKALTDIGSDDNFADFGPQFSKDYKSVYYVINNTIVRHWIDSDVQEVLYKAPESWETYTVPAFSDDGKYLLTVDFPLSGYVNRDNSNWDAFKEQSRLGLRSRLIKVNLTDGSSQVLIDTAHYEERGLKKNQWLGHPQFKPGSSEIVSYCHEGYGGTVDARIWLYDSSDDSLVCPRKHDYAGEIISHEFFTGDGQKIGFVRIENDASDRGSLRFVDSASFEEEIIMELPRCSHFRTDKTNRYVVADADYPAEPFIHLIDTQAKTDTLVLKHKSSMKSYGNTQDAHPHPLFSPDGCQIFFVSDMEGYPAVYRTDITDLIKKDRYDK